MTTNSRGFRDIDHQPTPPGLKVVILGDSFMEATQVEIAQGFPALLADQLSRSLEGPLEAINLGVAGFGTLQETLAYAVEGSRYRPRLVLLGFYLDNDLADNSEEITRKLPGLYPRPYLMDGILVPGNYQQALRAFDEALAHEREWRLFTLARSAFPPPPPEERWTEQEALMAKYSAYECVESPMVTRAWDTTSRIFDRLKRTVEADGARLAVFSIPSKLEIDTRYRNTKEEGRLAALCISDPPAWHRLASLLLERRIPFLDLRSAFRNAERRSDGPDLYLATDEHWSVDGHALAADFVADAIRDGGLISKPESRR